MATSFRTRRQFIASGLAVGVGLTAGCISITEHPRPSDELMTYHNAEFSYTVLYPSSWMVMKKAPGLVEITNKPFDWMQFNGQMIASAHEPVEDADSELTADVWHGQLSRHPNFESIDKQFIELPSGHTGIVIDTQYVIDSQYHYGADSIHEKTLFIVDRYTHAISITHRTKAFSGQFETMATEIVNSLTIV